MDDETLAVFQATTVLLSDWPRNAPRNAVDALFFFSRAHNDHHGLFDLAATLFTTSCVRHVAITGSRGEREGGTIPGEANPGKDFYLRELAAWGVRWNVVPANPAFNTKTEGEAFLSLAKKHGWRHAAIIAQPHQILRAFLGLVRSMATIGFEIPIFAAAPRSTSWWEHVYGSQGENLMARFEHIGAELERIRRYQASGELASFYDLFRYLRRRDAAYMTA